MRLFAGIPLGVRVVDELAAISMLLQADGDGLRWAAPQSWHITLQFLGNANQQQYECVADGLRGLRLRPVSIELESVGCFDRAGIFFAGVKLAPELLGLQQRVTAATSLCGFVSEERPYRPHVTLARSKGKDKARALDRLKAKIRQQPRFSRFMAEEFLLYESIPTPEGSHYEVRNRFSLKDS
jgi:2'-5' RNA ligase